MGLRVSVTAAANDFNIDLSILKRFPTQAAPDPIVFGAIATDAPGVSGPAPSEIYDPRMHDVSYVWDFGDPGETFQYLENKFAGQDNANIAYGSRVDHVYRTPGVKTVSVTGMYFHNGQMLLSTETLDVTVLQADYSGSNTLWVDPLGDMTDAPAGAAGPYTTLNDAIVATSGASGSRRILLNDDTTVNSGDMLAWASSHPSVLVDRSNTGTNAPTLNLNSTNGRALFQTFQAYDSARTKQVIFQNLNIPGNWDEATESGSDGSIVPFLFQNGGRAPGHFALISCTTPGWEATVQSNDGSIDHICIYDNDIPEFRSYGLLCDSVFWTVRGNRIRRQTDALSGGPKDGTHNVHGCLRGTGDQVLLVCQNDLQNFSGWWPNDFSIGGNSLYTKQPNCRLNVNQTRGSYIGVYQNSMEGGISVLSFRPSNEDIELESINFDVEMNLFVGCWMTGQFITCCHGGGKVANNVGVISNVYRSDTQDTTRFMVFNLTTANPDTAENLAAPLDILNNTVINFLTNANSASNDADMDNWYETGGNPFTGLRTVDGNLLHQPGISDTPFSNVDTSTIFNARGTSDYEAFDFGPVANSGIPINTPTLGQLTAGSTAKSRVGDPLTALDFFGNQRGQTDCFGAHFI